MRAIAVPICWPISALAILIQATPSRSMRNQIVGSNPVGCGAGRANAAGWKPGSAAERPNPNIAPAAEGQTNNDLRESAISALGRGGLVMGRRVGREAGRFLDRGADA